MKKLLVIAVTVVTVFLGLAGCGSAPAAKEPIESPKTAPTKQVDAGAAKKAAQARYLAIVAPRNRHVSQFPKADLGLAEYKRECKVIAKDLGDEIGALNAYQWPPYAQAQVKDMITALAADRIQLLECSVATDAASAIEAQHQAGATAPKATLVRLALGLPLN